MVGRTKIETQKKVSIAIPIAIANWLIEKTSLTFEQIADFCDIHPAIIQNMSSKDSRTSVLPKNPIGVYLTEEEIKRCENDKHTRLKTINNPVEVTNALKPKTKKYVSMANKRSRLDAAMWMVLFYSDIKSSVIAKLVKSTTKTVDQIKQGTYKAKETLTPKNPVVLGLCSKEELEKVVKKSLSVIPKK